MTRRPNGLHGRTAPGATDPLFQENSTGCQITRRERLFHRLWRRYHGIMGTNLGAYFRGKEEAALLDAIDAHKRPHYKIKATISSPWKSYKKYPGGAGPRYSPPGFVHEAQQSFRLAYHKIFFEQHPRDMLLVINLYSIVCAPGSAGTTQEIFMDATQNHYSTFQLQPHGLPRNAGDSR